jgi:hypothetical protein
MYSKGLRTIILGVWFIYIWAVPAQVLADTPTPVPGYVPTILPGISEEDQTFECPVGNPEGYGYVTPSPLWMLQCGHCLSENQPYVTPTPAYTPQPTPLPGNQYAYYTFQSGTNFKLNGSGDAVNTPVEGETYVSLEVDKAYSAWLSNTVNLFDTQSSSNYETYFFYRYELHVDACSAPYCGYNRSFYLSFKNVGASTVEVEVYDYDDGSLLQFYVLSTGQQVNMNLYTGGNCNVVNLDKRYIVNLKVTGSGASSTADFQISNGKTDYICGLHDKEITFYWNEGVYYFEEEVNSRCSEIVAEGDEEEDMYGFDYDGIYFGNTYCVDIGPDEAEILGITLEMPWIAHLCAQEVGIGNIKVFGVDVNLDIFIIMLAVAWALRNLFIS